MKPEPAALVARGVAAEHFAHARCVKLARVDPVEDRPARAWSGARAFCVLVGLRALADERRRDRLARQRLVEPRRRAVLALERGAVDAAEVGREPDVMLLCELDELV